MDKKRLIEIYTEEEVKRAEKLLKGLTWIGDPEEVLENLIKTERKKTHINFG